MKLTSRAELLALITLAGGCTHYASSSTFGQRQEVGRRLLGSPMVETTSSANLSAGYAGATFSGGYGDRYHVGGIDASADSVQRTHCVQQAQVDYVQPVDTFSIIEGRPSDVAGAVILGVVGLAVYGAARASYSFDVDNYNSDLEFYNRDPSFFPMPTYPDEPTTAYGMAAGLGIGAAAWLIYSYAVLPKGGAPLPARQERRWTETQYVEASGCGLVPGEYAQPPIDEPPPPPNF